MCEQWGDHQIQVSLHDEPGTIRCFDMWPCDHGTGGAPLKSAEQNQVKEFTCVKLGQKLALYPFAVHSKVGHAHIRTHTHKKNHELFWHFCWRMYPQDSYKILQVPVAKVLGDSLVGRPMFSGKNREQLGASPHPRCLASQAFCNLSHRVSKKWTESGYSFRDGPFQERVFGKLQYACLTVKLGMIAKDWQQWKTFTDVFFVSAQPVCIITSMAHEHNLQTWSELLRCIEHMALAFSSASLQLRKTALDLLVFGVSSPSMQPQQRYDQNSDLFFSVCLLRLSCSLQAQHAGWLNSGMISHWVPLDWVPMKIPSGYMVSFPSEET